MSFKKIPFAAVALCIFGAVTASAQNSGQSSTPGAAATGSPATVGVGPVPAPTPGQSISIHGNTPGTSQGIGPAPAPTPGQSTTIHGPGRTTGSAATTDGARPVQTPRQGRMRNARVPRDAATVGSRPESPARPDRFVTPDIVHESGGKPNTIATPPLHSQTGRPLPGATQR